MAVELSGLPFCDKNTWYSGNNGNYAPDKLIDGIPSSRWIGTNVDPVTSLQNFCGLKFPTTKNLTEVKVNIASWGKNFSIGTWATDKDPASATFTKADIVPIRAIDVTATPNDDNAVAIGKDKELRFVISASNCPGILFYSNDNTTSVLTNTPGSANTNISMNEVKVLGVDSSGAPEWVKQNGTAICSSQYNDFGTVAAVNDGNTATGWSGGNVGGNAPLDWVALQFASGIKPRRVELNIYSWGKTIIFGYTDAAPTSKGSFVIVRSIDVTVTPNDDFGIPWGRQKTNTLLFPDTVPSGSIWGVYTNDAGANILGAGGGAVDRVRMMEFSIYATTQTASDGLNPKPPTTVPVVPFSATPSGWTRTEFSAAGTFNFTPAADTTLLMAVGLGAGAGGRVNVSTAGVSTPNDATRNGGDSIVANTSGQILIAPGGKTQALADLPVYPSILRSVDWLKLQDQNARAGVVTALGSNAAQPGGQSYLNTVANTGYTLAAQDTNGPVTASTTLTGSVALPFTPTFVNASRNTSLGLTTNIALATAGTPTQTASFEFSFKAVAGQTIAINVGFYIPDSQSAGTYKFNNDAPVAFNVSSGSTTTLNFTVTTDGTQTFRFDLSTTATSGGVPYIRATLVTITGVGQAGASSGASGRAAAIYLIPQALTLTVGAGGIGQAGGQSVTAAQNGLRGSGGAPGGSGGAGVIVIYEFKGSVVFEKPIVPLFSNYNNMTVDPVGIYRTNYIGQGLGTKQNYSHKLRPRTKYVYVIMTGAGGGTVQTYTGPSTAVPNDPAIVSAGSKTFTAGSGSSSYRVNAGNSQYPCAGGDGGVFTSNAETIYQTNGPGGNNFANPNSSGVVNNYGWSGGGVQGAGDGINNSAWPGGAGSTAMFILSGDDIANGTIDIQVPGGGRAPAAGQYDVGNPGAVFIFETESGFGYATTQTSELILQKSPIPATQVTQVSELVLQKSALGAIRTTQVSELVLVKDTSVPDMQVANVYATLVFDAPPTGLNVTQTSELVLQKNKIGGTAVTQTAELVLQKTPRSPYRVTQVSELFLVAETPTVFWLNFGILDAPIRFQLYDSAIGRASSVPPNCKIQIEGFFAEGTHLVINGVPSGVLADVKNTDRVYIHGGVTNYWQANIPVYAYYEQNGETARMLVGNWIINQPQLVPLITKAYYGTKVTPTWIQTRAGVGSLVTLQSIITKALMSLVQLTMTAVQNKFGSLVDLLQEKTTANSRVAEVTIGWDVTKALSEVSDSVSWIYTQALSTDVKNVVTWGTQKAQVSEYKQADFIAPQAKYGDVTIAYDVRTDGSTGYVTFDSESYVLSVNYSHFTLDTTQTQAGYGDYVVEEFDKTNAAYGKVDKEYEYNNVDHSVTYEVVYVAVQSSSVARLFPMEPMGTIAYSVLTGMEWERSTAQGTGDWVIPTFSALNLQAKYGMFSAAGVDSNVGHSEYSQRETEVINGPQLGYFGTTSMWVQTYSVYAEREATVKRSEKTVAFDVTPIKTTAKTGVFNLTPFLAMQSVNGIGKASLYKGFDTKAEVDQFTENFSGVHTALKYNGYVYTLDVDKSFICEIFNNGPVKWLLQGG